MNYKREKWIDIARFIAIIAVMVNHTADELLWDEQIIWYSYFSVSLFVLVMGINSYYSYCRYDGDRWRKVWSKCLKILRPYLIATLLYSIIIDGEFSLFNYLDRVVHFNASSPLYYVLLYIQLTIIAPVLYYILEKSENCKHKLYCEMFGLILVGFVGWFTTNHSNLLNVYGGGGKLFGGTYLSLIYIGMLIGKYNNFQLARRGEISALIVSMITLAGWLVYYSRYRLRMDLYTHLKEFFNPPGVSLGLYATIILITLLFGGRVIKTMGKESVILTWPMICIGRHTLYIFLYHRLFIDFVIPFLERNVVSVSNILGKRVLYFALMIVGSICIELFLEKAHRITKNIYRTNNS